MLHMHSASDLFEKLRDNAKNYGFRILEDDPRTLVDDSCSFLGGKKVVQILTHGAGIVSFGRTQIKAHHIPTLDLFLDRVCDLPDTYLFHRGCTYAAGKKAQAAASSGSVNRILSGPDRLLDHIVWAGKALPLAVQYLLQKGVAKEALLCGMGTCPVVYRGKCHDEHKSRMLAAGAVCSVWLRAQDSSVHQLAKDWKGSFELRLHNTKSGNCFVNGSRDEEELARLAT